MIVDDRIVIIGSANINERSQRGDRDSELACVLRDTDMVESRMGGKPYRVGRFAHTMRMRLQMEHCGVDTDEFEKRAANMDLLSRKPVEDDGAPSWDPDHEQTVGHQGDPNEKTGYLAPANSVLASTLESASEFGKGIGQMFSAGAQRGGGKVVDAEDEVRGKLSGDKGEVQAGKDGEAERIAHGQESTDTDQAPSAAVPTVEETAAKNERKKPRELDLPVKSNGGSSSEPLSPGSESATSPGAGSRRFRGSISSKTHPFAIPTPPVDVDPLGFEDPLSDDFYERVWLQLASRNTQIYRKVFRCTPDDLCLTWAQFREWSVAVLRRRQADPAQGHVVAPA